MISGKILINAGTQCALDAHTCNGYISMSTTEILPKYIRLLDEGDPGVSVKEIDALAWACIWSSPLGNKHR